MASWTPSGRGTTAGKRAEERGTRAREYGEGGAQKEHTPYC